MCWKGQFGLTKVNRANIVLILKVEESPSISQFRTICLCDVVYKIHSQKLAKTFKKHLPRIITKQQIAFAAKRQITDNALIVMELFLYLKRKLWVWDILLQLS